MKEHEIFQTGARFEVDGIIINDMFETELYAFVDNYGKMSIDMKSMYDDFNLNLTEKELDAMIGFLTFVRSKMEGDK